MKASATKGVPLLLTAHHVISAVGADAELTCAALRAGVTRIGSCDFYLPDLPGPEADDEPLMAAYVPALGTELDGMDRLLALGLGALRGIVDRARLARAELPRTGLLVALPAADPVIARWSLGQIYLPMLLARAGITTIAPTSTAVEQSGHTGVLALLARAGALLESGAVDQCLVLGIDSYIDSQRLDRLDDFYRLKSQRGVDGFTPGEAAVALLVERSNPRVPPRRPPLLRLGPPQLAMEPQPFDGERASTGVGLATVLRAVRKAAAQPRPSSWFLCDLNGESYRAFEWGLVQVRLTEELAAPLVVRHPADCLGDIGAASGGLLVACAAQAFARKYNSDDVATIWTASDPGVRSAMLAFAP